MRSGLAGRIGRLLIALLLANSCLSYDPSDWVDPAFNPSAPKTTEIRSSGYGPGVPPYCPSPYAMRIRVSPRPPPNSPVLVQTCDFWDPEQVPMLEHRFAAPDNPGKNVVDFRWEYAAFGPGIYSVHIIVFKPDGSELIRWQHSFSCDGDAEMWQSPMMSHGVTSPSNPVILPVQFSPLLLKDTHVELLFRHHGAGLANSPRLQPFFRKKITDDAGVFEDVPILWTFDSGTIGLVLNLTRSTARGPVSIMIDRSVKVVRALGRGHPDLRPEYKANFLPPLESRDDFGWFAEYKGYKVGLEVGVADARYSTTMLTLWPSCTTYYAMDAWTCVDPQTFVDRGLGYSDFHGDQSSMVIETDDKQGRQCNMLKLAQRYSVQRRMERFEQFTMIQNFSMLAVEQFEDSSLDWIYIDASHDYTSVLEDATAYWTKLRPGGMLAGHDFLDQETVKATLGLDWDTNLFGKPNPPGRAVRSAALDFAASVGRQVLVTYRDYPPSWYLLK